MIGDWLTTDTIWLLLHGFWLTIVLSAITSISSCVLGIAAGTCRLAHGKGWRVLGAVHVEFHRNVPALVLIIFWAFAVPNVFPPDLRRTLFFNNPVINWVAAASGLPLVYYALALMLALTLNTSAYIAELFRAGVGTIAQEHVDAARGMGATPSVVYRTILLPQGVRAAFPAISTRLIHNMKNTSLAAFVSVPELFHSTETAITRTFQAGQLLLLTSILYLLLAGLFSAALRQIERRLNSRRSSVVRLQSIKQSHG